MDKEVLINSEELKDSTATQIFEKLYNKELNCKKNILEYIDLARSFKKQGISEEQIKDTYDYIYEHIEGLKDIIKPNTMMYLKNTLKASIGKFVKEKDPKPVNGFIEFFKKAYPEDNRRKDFTWVLMDIDNITEEQVWNTLVYINRECLNNNLRLTSGEKKDIAEVVEKLVKRNNVKYIKNLMSLRQLMDILGISIVGVGEIFKIKYKKQVR